MDQPCCARNETVLDPRLGSGRSWARLLGSVVILNCFFLVAALWAASLPSERFTSRVTAAFASWELVDEDYLRGDTRRGFPQYTDCRVLQIIINPDAAWWPHALGPLVYYKDAKYDDSCLILHGLIDGTLDRSDLLSFRYTRYWLGFVPIATALLRTFSLHRLRLGLKLTVYASLILLVLSAALRHRRTLPVVAVIAFGCLGFWRLPEFSKSLSQAPGDTAVILGLATLIFWHRFLMRPEIFAAYCGAYGAVLAYLEFLSGLIPTAAGFLFPLAYLLAAYPPGSDSRPSRGWAFAVTALAALGAGVLLTVLVKQILAFLAVGSATYQDFVDELAFWASTEGWRPKSSGRIAPYWWLLKASAPPDLHLVLSSSGIVWATAAFLAWCRGNWRACSDVAAFLVGAAAVAAWVQILPFHTIVHYEWMVRILIVPITLGWAALIWLTLAPGLIREGT